jgi:hypothetical protein
MPTTMEPEEIAQELFRRLFSTSAPDPESYHHLRRRINNRGTVAWQDLRSRIPSKFRDALPTHRDGMDLEQNMRRLLGYGHAFAEYLILPITGGRKPDPALLRLGAWVNALVSLFDGVLDHRDHFPGFSLTAYQRGAQANPKGQKACHGYSRIQREANFTRRPAAPDMAVLAGTPGPGERKRTARKSSRRWRSSSTRCYRQS